MNNKFSDLFSISKPIIGMIHLAGDDLTEKTSRAMEELRIYQEEGIDGAIVENYHSTGMELIRALSKITKEEWKLKLGINTLGVKYCPFQLVVDFDLSFLQLDSVMGREGNNSIEKEIWPDIPILGGVRFKYQPSTGRTLEQDIIEGKSRCDAVVTTGEGTGQETPLDKLVKFRGLLRDYPLVVGAGVNLANVSEQLAIVDAAIVGSYFKPNGNTYLPVDRARVRDLMSAVRELRKTS